MKINLHMSDIQRRPEHDVLSTTIWQKFKLLIFFIQKTQHATHILKLVDKICKYEMNLASIVEDTEQTQFGLQRDDLASIAEDTERTQFGLQRDGRLQ